MQILYSDLRKYLILSYEDITTILLRYIILISFSYYNIQILCDDNLWMMSPLI